MKSLLQLLREVLTDVGTWCGVNTSRDYLYVSTRAEHEGLPFLAVTLATFGRDSQRALALGRVTDDMFVSFKRHAGLPTFLSGFLRNVFDPATGLVLDDPCHHCVFAIRQVTMMFAKIESPLSEAQLDRAFADYIETERVVKDTDNRISKGDLDEELKYFDKVGSVVWGELFTKVNASLFDASPIPKHSSGSTADRVLGNSKYLLKSWPVRLNRSFPSWDFVIPSPRFSSYLDCVSTPEPGAEQPVRVISVPKTFGKPRIIAMEPVAVQYCQQALLGLIRDHMKTDLGSKFVNFDDQSLNRDMAREGSISGELATLDLSSASDLVSNQLVRRLLTRYRLLREAVDDSRSRLAEVPGHGIIRISKYSSMGSALCFPFETAVFVTIVISAIVSTEMQYDDRGLARRVRNLVGQVRAYGDDIIVPTRFATTVIDWLETFGLKVNRDKSFLTGKFRESCGGDYFDGYDVGIVRVRTQIAASRHLVRATESTVSLRNLLYSRGLWRAAKWLDGTLVDKLGHFPTVLCTAGVMGRHSFSIPYEEYRMDDHLQQPIVKGWSTQVELKKFELDDMPALLKVLLHTGEPRAVDHLIRDGRAKSVTMRLGWHIAY